MWCRLESLLQIMPAIITQFFKKIRDGPAIILYQGKFCKRSDRRNLFDKD